MPCVHASSDGHTAWGDWLNGHWLLTRRPDKGDVGPLHFLMQMCVGAPRLVSFGKSTKWSQGRLHAVLCFGNAACVGSKAKHGTCNNI